MLKFAILIKKVLNISGRHINLQDSIDNCTQ